MRKGSLFLIAAALVVPYSVHAQTGDWPAKPIKIVVPSAAGGAADFLARSFGRYFAQQAKQSVVVENRPGAGAIIGAQAVKASAPDGYTYLLSGMSTQSANPILYSNLPYDPQKDFDEIGMFGTFPMIGLAKKDGPLRTVADLINFAKANPGKLSFGHHAASALVPVELIKGATGVVMTGVPYKNVTQISVDIASGVLDFAFIDALSAAPALKGGLLSPIAVTSPQRFAALPNVQAIAEVLPGYAMVGWLGLSAPAGTPKPVLDRMNGLLRDALGDPAVKAGLEGQGLTVRAVTIDEQKAWVWRTARTGSNGSGSRRSSASNCEKLRFDFRVSRAASGAGGARPQGRDIAGSPPEPRAG